MTTASLTAGGTLQLSAIVKTAAGDVLSGQTVTYASDKTAVATVGSTGLVTAAGLVGSANITGSAGSATSVPTVITVSAAAAQNIAKGTDLPASLLTGSSNSVTVKVTDSFGNPVPGVAVTFAATVGGGSVTPQTTTSDATGLATTVFKIGGAPGVNTATATAAGLTGSPITFSGTSVAGPAAGVAASITSVNPDPTGTFNVGSAYRGTGGAVAIVKDFAGNPVSHVVVTFALANAPSGFISTILDLVNAGTILPIGSVLTSADGTAKATFLSGSVAGVNTATATVAGISSPAVFSMTTVNPGMYGFTDIREILGPEDLGIAPNLSGYGPADVSAFELPDGRIRIFFGIASPDMIGRTGSAVSNDGTHFVVEPGYRVPSASVQTGFSSPLVFALPGGGYRWFYTAGGSTSGLASATSSDGVNFVEDPGIRIASPANTGAACGGILKLADGRYRIYCSNEISRTVTYGAAIIKSAIFSAVSTDLLNWTLEPGYLIGSGAPTLTDEGNHPTPIVNANGTVSIIFYRSFDTKVFTPQEWVATSADGRTFTSEVNTGVSGTEPSLVRRKDGSMLLFHGGMNRPGNSTLVVAKVAPNTP